MPTTVLLFKGAFKAFSANAADFLRLIYGWLALSYILLSITHSLRFFGITDNIAIFLDFAFLALTLFASASIGVGWSRLLLPNETPTGTYPNFGAREFAYLGRTLIIGGIFLAVLIPVIVLTVWPPSRM